MAIMSMHMIGLGSSSPVICQTQKKSLSVVSLLIPNSSLKERLRMKELFRKVRERCMEFSTEDLPFTVEEVEECISECGHSEDIGTKFKGNVTGIYDKGADFDALGWTSGYLPIQEASIQEIKNIREAGIFTGMETEFMIIGRSKQHGTLIVSLRQIQLKFSWERCRQLQTEDAVLMGKVVGGNRGGLIVVVEGIDGFVPISHYTANLTVEELLEKEIPLKVIELEEEKGILTLSYRKAISDTKKQLQMGEVYDGVVHSVKPYGAFVDIGGIAGLLHISQISHNIVSDISRVLKPGDKLKVMVIKHENQKLSFSTKSLEPSPGDMIHNRGAVLMKAEEMAHGYRQRIAQAEAMATATLSRFRTEAPKIH